MSKFFYASYMLWMLAGFIGFPLSVGWLFYRVQKQRQADTDHERAVQQEKVRTAAVVMGLFLIALIGFLVFSATPIGQRAQHPG